MRKLIDFFLESKKMTAILLAFLLIGGIASGIYFNRSSIKDKISPKPEKVSVVIDAGHGGKDFGASYGGRNEKDDNLRLALKVKEHLEEKGISVALTRSIDIYMSLENRCNFANIRSADLFVSLHRNSVSGNANGVEIWIGSEDSPESRALAQTILDSLEDAGISENRGVKSGFAREGNDYYVNSHTNMPSCLVELGFITSKTDNTLYDENLDAYAKAIADSIELQLTEKKTP